MNPLIVTGDNYLLTWNQAFSFRARSQLLMAQPIGIQAFRTQTLTPHPRDNHQQCPALQQPPGFHITQASRSSFHPARGNKTPRHLIAGYRSTSMVRPGSPTAWLSLTMGRKSPRLLWLTTQILHGIEPVLRHPPIPTESSYRQLLTQLQQVITHQISSTARSVPVIENLSTVARHSDHPTYNLEDQTL